MNGAGPLAAFLTSELGLGTILARMIVATLLGCLLGIDREYLNRPAGLRTHMLVSLAAATFAIITFELMEQLAANGAVNADPIRVIEAVTAGVAFLAAGTIIQARNQVHGLTTGAGLWLAGAVGTASGVGAYSTAVAATVFGIVVLIVLRLVTQGGDKPMAARDETGRTPAANETGTRGGPERYLTGHSTEEPK